MKIYKKNDFLGLVSLCAVIGSLVSFGAKAAAVPELDCVIEPHMVIDLSSRTDGIVETMHAERGDFIETGQVLVQLESSVEEAAVEYARVAALAEAELQSGQVSRKFAERRSERMEVLYRDQAVSPDQMDEIETEARLRKLSYQQAKERKQLAALELQRAQEVLDRHTLRSPIDGVVVERYLAPGESVEEKPIMRLAQINPLRVEVIAPVRYFGEFSVGQLADVMPEHPITDSYEAEVSVVDRVVDAASGTFRVRLSLPNPDHKLPSGLNCRVKFKAKAPSALPSVAAQKSAEPVAACFSIGPIDDAQRVQELESAFAESSASVFVRKESSTQSKGFIVTSPNQGDTTSAKALAKSLEADGYPDLRVFSRGVYKDRVLFGLYDDKNLAIDRKRELEAAGYNAEARPRSVKVTQHWLDILGPEDFSAKDLALVDDTGEMLAEADISPRECDSLLAVNRE